MAGRLTYHSLYELVKAEINKSATFNTKSGYSSQLSRDSIVPVSAPGASEVNISEIITNIQNFLRDALPAFIKSGLTVTAQDTPSAVVTIAAGSGSAAGILYTLASDTDITIPFDSTSEVFYLNLYKDRILVEKNADSEKLSIAKIIVPNPGVTSRVIDKNDGSDDAYIINLTEYKLHGDGNGNFEEDTVELLRQNISPILADNLIGNIRLNEDLKIINTQGTMELDSSEMRLLNTDGDILAKFNRNGTFFYNSSGIEIAKFGSTEARVGNILITPTSIQSTNFSEDVSGFRIRDNGNAEFENVKIRGAFHTAVFIKDTISAIGGNLLVAESDLLTETMTVLDSATLTIEGNVAFAVGDILRIKDQDNDEWFQVTDISSAPTYVVTRDKDSFYTSNNNPAWQAGATVVNYGQSGEGHIFITSSLSNSPYLSVLTHTGTPWDSQTDRLRLGRLDGFLDYPELGESGYSGPYYGIAIGEATKYLKYDPDGGLVLRGNLTMDEGYIGGPNGWLITTNEIVGSSSAVIRGGMSAYATGSGFWLGYATNAYKFAIGDATNYLRWDGTTLTITGSINMAAVSLTIGSGVITSNSFVDTLAGDIAIGAIFARKTLEHNEKFRLYQERYILESGSYESGNPDALVIDHGLIEIPTIARFDDSGAVWDESGDTWDSTHLTGEYTYTSSVTDVGFRMNGLVCLEAVQTLTADDTIEVEFSVSEDNINYSDWFSASRQVSDGISTFYADDIRLFRYFKYRITFTSVEGSILRLANIYVKTLALYVTLIFPDYAISSAGTTITDLHEHFSTEYSISILPHGSTLVRPQISSKSDPPYSVTVTLVNDSSTAVSGTADIHMIGY